MNHANRHMEAAERFLEQAKETGNTKRALDWLYEAMVEVTRAINELEQPREPAKE